MYREVIKLINESSVTNEYGDPVITTSERIVFAEEKSIFSKEFYQAQAIGLEPEIKFEIADFLDYQNEKKLKYTPYKGTEKEYVITRTLRIGNKLEITCKRGID